MISMRRVVRPVWISIMRRQQPYPSTRLCYSMQFGNKRDHIGHMLDDVIGNDQLKLTIGKRVRQLTQIVNNVGAGAWVVVQPNSTRRFIYSAADVKDLHCGVLYDRRSRLA